MKRPSYKKLFEMACEERGKGCCPAESYVGKINYDFCNKMSCKINMGSSECWQRYFKEKIDE